MGKQEHLPNVEIAYIDIYNPFPGDGGLSFYVGRGDVTCIEAFVKSGMYADVAYVRVWKGEQPFAEFCQHNIVGVYFKTEG